MNDPLQQISKQFAEKIIANEERLLLMLISQGVPLCKIKIATRIWFDEEKLTMNSECVNISKE